MKNEPKDKKEPLQTVFVQDTSGWIMPENQAKVEKTANEKFADLIKVDPFDDSDDSDKSN